MNPADAEDPKRSSVDGMKGSGGEKAGGVSGGASLNKKGATPNAPAGGMSVAGTRREMTAE
jgi:hypothetical protein